MRNKQNIYDKKSQWSFLCFLFYGGTKSPQNSEGKKIITARFQLKIVRKMSDLYLSQCYALSSNYVFSLKTEKVAISCYLFNYHILWQKVLTRTVFNIYLNTILYEYSCHCSVAFREYVIGLSSNTVPCAGTQQPVSFTLVS